MNTTPSIQVPSPASAQLVKEPVHLQQFLFAHAFNCSVTSALKSASNLPQIISKGPIQPSKTSVEVKNIYPRNEPIPSVFEKLYKHVYPTGMKILREADGDKYTKILRILTTQETAECSDCIDYKYFAIQDPSNSRLLRCVAGTFYTAEVVQDKKRTTTLLFPVSIIISSEFPCYHPMKQFIQYLISLRVNPLPHIIEIMSIEPSFPEDPSVLEEFVVATAFSLCEVKEANHKVNVILTTPKEANNVAEQNQNGTPTPPVLHYYNKNGLNYPLMSLMCPSNSSFEKVIFKHSVSNLFYLVVCAMMEYQIVLTATSASTAAIFCENIIQLIKPFTWQGVYIPSATGIYDYKNATEPYIIGLTRNKDEVLDRFQKHPKNRVIYDIDGNEFLHKAVINILIICFFQSINTKTDIAIPASYKNYLLRNLNTTIAEMRFWEDKKMTVEGEMKFKLHFYNFFLLSFHDILNYFQKGSPPPPAVQQPNNTSAAAALQKQAQQNTTKQQQQTKQTKAQQPVIEEPAAQPDISAIPPIVVNHAYFKRSEYIASFGAQDLPFFEKVSQTKQFEEFVKQCFYSIDYKDMYIRERREVESDFTFHMIFQYVNDCRFLAKRKQNETLNQKITEIEQFQANLLTNKSQNQLPEFTLILSSALLEFLCGNLQTRVNQEAKTTGRSYFSSENKTTAASNPQLTHPISSPQALLQQQQKAQQQLAYREQVPSREQTVPNNSLKSFDFAGPMKPSGHNNLDFGELSKIENINSPFLQKSAEKKQLKAIINDLNELDECEHLSTVGSNHSDSGDNNFNNRRMKSVPNSLDLMQIQKGLQIRMAQEAEERLEQQQQNERLIVIMEKSGRSSTNKLLHATLNESSTQAINIYGKQSDYVAQKEFPISFLTSSSSSSGSDSPRNNTPKGNLQVEQKPGNTLQGLKAGCFDLWGGKYSGEEEGDFKLF